MLNGTRHAENQGSLFYPGSQVRYGRHWNNYNTRRSATQAHLRAVDDDAAREWAAPASADAVALPEGADAMMFDAYGWSAGSAPVMLPARVEPASGRLIAQVAAAADLLQQNPNPSDDEVRHGLEGNLCRCTGYHNIVRAVQYAAAKMRGDEVTA